MRTLTKKILAIVLVGVMVAAGGCTGWGTDGPADNESDGSDTGDDPDDEQNQSQNQSDSDDSDSDTSSGDSSTGSDSDSSESDSSSSPSDSDADSSDDSSDSSDCPTDCPDQSDGDNNTGDEPETHELTVAVETPDGEPATGLPVEVVTHEGGETVASTTTNENGNAVFNLENGGYEILVDISDTAYTHYGTFLVGIDGEDKTYRIPLSATPGGPEDTHDLDVTVDNHNGEPVEGANVTVVTADGGDEVATGKTDSNGAITFDVPNGEYDISADHEDARRDAVSRVTVNGPTEDSLTLDTSEGLATGVVKVVDQNGDPVEGEEVTLWPPGAVEEEATETRETDENGEVRIELLAGDPSDVVMFDVVVRDQEQTLAIMADAYTGVQEVVFEVDTTGVDEPGRTLEVTVVDQNGDPLEGASIHATGPVLSNGAAHEPSGETNADGVATLTAYDGEYDLEVQYDGEITEDHVTVDGDTKTTVEVETSETGEETNTLTVHAESAVTVESTEEDGMSETQEPTDRVATFEVPDGGYVITADGYHPADLPFVDSDAEITLQDTDGATMDITVTDAESGDPVAGAEISGVCDLHYSSGDSYIETESPSGSDGIVTVQTDVTPTTCDATVTADGYGDAQITLDAPDDDGRTVELQSVGAATPDPGENETNATVALASVG